MAATSLAQRVQQADRGFQINQNGLVLTKELTSKAEWSNLGRLLVTTVRAYQWALADWINLHRGEWGSTYEDAAKILDRDPDYCRVLAQLGRDFPPATRNIAYLNFSHYKISMALPPENRMDFLKDASAEGVSGRKFREIVQQFNNKREFSPGRQRQREAVHATRKNWVRCPCPCKHEFPIEGNKIKEPSVEAEVVATGD